VLVPPEVLVGPTVVLRRGGPDDAEAVAALVAANLDHLRPWMGWASAPAAVSVDAQRTRLAGLPWAPGEEWGYLMRDPGDDALLGACSLMHRRGPGTLEIGYWVDRSRTGRGIATAAARSLTEAGRRIEGIERIWILTDEANVRSAAVPRRLGFVLDRVDATPIDAPAATGRTQWWRFDAGAARPRTEAADASTGR
jgi:RimJ/RimL family protein N-acetyltransferase